MNRRPSILRHVVFECPDALEQNRQAGFEIISIANSNVHKVRDFRDDRVKELFTEFLREGRTGVFVVHEGGIVAHGWLTTSLAPRAVVNGYFPLREQESLIHHCHVAEHVRGRGVFGMLIAHLASQRVGRVLIDTPIKNSSSQRAIQKAGCARLGTATFLAWHGHLLVCRTSPKEMLA